MVDQGKEIEAAQGSDWRPRVYMLGGLLGAALGVLSAYLYVRAAEEKGSGSPELPSTGDGVRLGISLLSIIRTIAEWGSR